MSNMQVISHLSLLMILAGGHELSKSTGNAGARIGCGNFSLYFVAH